MNLAPGLVLVGGIFFIAFAILSFLMPLFVFRIRNEIIGIQAGMDRVVHELKMTNTHLRASLKNAERQSANLDAPQRN